MRQRKRRFLIGAAALALVAGLAVAPSSPAQAVTIPTLQWPAVSLSDMTMPQHVVSQTDGGVTLGCSPGATNGFQSFSSSGAGTQTVARVSGTKYHFTCAGQSAVGANGVVYTDAWDSSTNREVLVAYSGSSAQWVYEQPCSTISSVVVGANGNIYLLVSGGYCGSPKLVGVKPTLGAGQTVPDVVANTDISRNVVANGALSPYSGGIVVRFLDGIGFYDYSGVRQTDAPGWNLSLGGFDGQPFATADTGWAMVPILGTSQLCSNDTNAVASINAYGVGGLIWSHQLPPCSHVDAIRPTYSGGAVVLLEVQTTGQFGPVYKQQLYAISPTGDGQHPAWLPIDVPHGVAGDNTNYMLSLGVDLNGNVALLRAYQWNADYKPGVEFSLIDGASGINVGHFVVEGNAGDSYGFVLQQTDAIPAIANGTVYLPLTECSSFSSCSYSTTKLYAVKVPGLTLDYPRGAVLTDGVAWKNYVAMGDSYSSGEGVEPFDSATDTAGPPENRCHRSNQAYGKLLHNNPALRLHLSAFVACSGAKTAYINGPWPSGGINTNEAAQTSALSSSTNLVTVSIGGNDVEFGKLAATCLLAECSTYRQQYMALVDGLGTALGSAYDQILSHAPNATVYVVGYPRVLAATGCPQTDANMQILNQLAGAAAAHDQAAIATLTAIGVAQGLSSVDMGVMLNSGSIQFSDAELSLIYDFTSALSEKIYTVVASKGPRMKYVDPLASGSPFIGHELCTADPYFNALVVGTAPAYSFHPNLKGQSAYRQLLVANF